MKPAKNQTLVICDHYGVAGPAEQDFEWGGLKREPDFFWGGGGQRHATLGKLIIMGFKMKIRVLVTLRYRKVDLILTNSVC